MGYQELHPGEHSKQEEMLVLGEARRVAIDAAIAASEHIMQYWSNPTNSLFDRKKALEILNEKEGTGNFATIADIESEEMLIRAIRANSALRTHDIITEESEQTQTGSDWKWINDPIDGTLNFTNGLPDFGVSVGLHYRGQPVLGVIALPEKRQLVVGERGKGAYLYSFDGKQLADLRELAGSVTLPLRQSIVGYDVGYEDRKGQYERYVLKFADHVGAPVSYYSCVTAQMKVAQGLLGGYIMEVPKLFDIGAGAAILPEAGCPVSGMDGKPIDWNAPKRTFLTGRNTAIHAQLISILGS